MISGKFAITLHIVTLLTKFPEEYLSSEFIACSLNTNAVLVRKEIANLKKHNFVISKEGKSGGAMLAKPATAITLDDIFKITHDTFSLGYCKNEPNAACPVGKDINTRLETLYADITGTVCNTLKDITIQEFAGQ